MTWESGSTDQQRLRAGYAVLSLGVFILLCTWVLFVMRGPEGVGEAATRGQKVEPPDPNQVLPALGAGVLLFGALLLIVFSVSVVALLRMGRNYRKSLLQKSSKPTPTSDVWKMHKVPVLPEDDQWGDPRPPEPPTSADAT